MSALALPGGPGRRRPAITLGRAAALGGVALVAVVIWNLMSAQIVTERPNEMKTTTVMLPPPPPPPPEVKPEEKPPEPTQAPPIAEPLDTPPPPEPLQQQAAAPSPGDSALTAREGAGPSNYGLGVGNGSGTRIGGRPGGASGDGFAAYAGVALSAIRLATQADRDLARGRYTTRLLVEVDAEGRISSVRVVDGSGDARRDARLRQLLTGLQLSRRPPPGLPAMRLELNARPGA